VSPGGEEFTSKLDKLIAANVSVITDRKRPNFLHGTLQDIVKNSSSEKPLLIYLSGEDPISNIFETRILIQTEIIALMVFFTY